MLDPLVSVSGVRGTTVATSLGPPSLFEDRVHAWAAAFAEQLGKGAQVVIGRDTRPSGKWMIRVAGEAFEKHGVQTVIVGVVPTPTVQLAVTHHQANGGLIITASHNPEEWNGLKFLGHDGVFLSAHEMAVLQHTTDRTGTRECAIIHDSSPATLQDDSAIERHVENVLDLPLDVSAIRRSRFRVVLDPVNGTGALAVPPLLEALGCSVTVMNGEPTGQFAHPPEPTPENLTALGERVRTEKADLGAAVDPDADRLVLVDERGTVLSEEYTVTLATLSVLSSAHFGSVSNTLPKFVVVNLSTTRMVEDVAKQFGVRVVRTAVGERLVIEGMRQHRALIGGEGNGGVIFPASHEGRDALVGAALVLDLLAHRDVRLSDLANALPHYVMVKEKIPQNTAFATAALARTLQKDFPDAVVSSVDGVRLDMPDGWAHLRPSNTEPLLRLITEARTEARVEQLRTAVCAALSVRSA